MKKYLVHQLRSPQLFTEKTTSVLIRISTSDNALARLFVYREPRKRPERGLLCILIPIVSAQRTRNDIPFEFFRLLRNSHFARPSRQLQLYVAY